MTGIPDLGIRVDIMGRVLDPLLCVFLADIQSVGIGACMHVCVWYTELTCISNGVSKTKFLIYVKLVLISDTYCILIYCYLSLLPHKKGGELTLGSSLDPVDLQLYRKRGK